MKGPTPIVRIPALAALVCAAAFAGAGCAGVSKLDFTRLGRDGWQRPEEVTRALGIQPGESVADLGAGEGYFVPHLLEAVGAAGRVYAVDVDPDVTEDLYARYAGGPGNVEVVLGSPDDPGLPDGKIDLILIVNTYHHIDGRPDYFRRLRADLSERGRIAILEPNAELTGVLTFFLDDGHTSRADEVVAEMRAAGYRPTARHDFLATQIFEVFAPDRAQVSARE
jgi:ubiquinone/menaquinone biosynthesis C-methylase UbiE